MSDHRALCEATRSAREVIPVFVFDPEIVQKLPRSALRRLEFLEESLRAMDKALEKKRSGLLVVEGDPRKRLPELARALKVDSVFWNRDYEPWAKERDASVGRILENSGIAWRSFKDQVVFEGSEILSGKGTPYRVFSPYERAWRKSLNSESLRQYEPNFAKLVPRSSGIFVSENPRAWGSAPKGESAVFSGGLDRAEERMRRFFGRIGEYARQRDFPSLHATSELSPYLRFGELSVRQLFRLAGKKKGDGPRKWESELIWRDYFFMVLDQFPHVVDRSFNETFAFLKWPGLEEHFSAWCEGRTGFPLVDAAMRSLLQTGWMHNRLRMVVATFLIKDLLIDWRRGEKFFAAQLVDYELASNNGGWQWCASTGADSQPWFRIFNPVEQSRKFDPDGAFIREYCPELRGLSSKEIHFPGKSVREQTGYPQAIVEHSVQRSKALKLYGDAAKRAKREK